MLKVKITEIPTPRLIETPWGVKCRSGFKKLWAFLLENSLNNKFSTEVVLSPGLLNDWKLSRRTAMRFIKYLIDAKLIQKASRQLGSGRGVIYRNIWVENHVRWCVTKMKVLKKNKNTINDSRLLNKRINIKNLCQRESTTSAKNHVRRVFYTLPSDFDLEVIWKNLHARAEAGLRAPAIRRACQLVRLTAWREGLSIEEQRQFTNFIGSLSKRVPIEKIPECVEHVLKFVRERWDRVKARLWRVRQQLGLREAKRQFFAMLTRWLGDDQPSHQHENIYGELSEQASDINSRTSATHCEVRPEIEQYWNYSSSTEEHLAGLSPDEAEDFWREVYAGAERERLLLHEREVKVINVTSAFAT